MPLRWENLPSGGVVDLPTEHTTMVAVGVGHLWSYPQIISRARQIFLRAGAVGSLSLSDRLTAVVCGEAARIWVVEHGS